MTFPNKVEEGAMAGKVHFAQGNMFDSTAEALVIPVNIQGEMSAGVSFQTAQKWPAAENRYMFFCSPDRGAEKFDIGQLLHIPEDPETSQPELILFPTKRQWFKSSKLEYVKRGLETLVRHYCVEKAYSFKSIAIPAVGCGYGKLLWGDVRPLLENTAKHLSASGCDVTLYVPQGEGAYDYD